jgi:hypothetical protein
MKIQELVEQQQLSELDVGQGISKAVGGVARGVGAVAGGIAGIPSAVKKGYQAGKAAVGGTDPEQPATGVAPSGAGQFTASSSNPVTIRSQIRQHQAAISQLQQQLSAPAADDEEDPADAAPSASNVRPFVRTTQPTNTTPTTQNTTQPTSTTQPADQSPAEKRKADWAAAADVAQKDMAANPVPSQQTSTPASPQTPAEKRKADFDAAAQVAQDQMGPPGQPVTQPTTEPTPTGLGAAGNIRPGAPQPDPKAQQAALKAKIQADRAAGTNLAAQTGTGFNDYVAGGKGFTAGPNGEPVQKVAREGLELYSRFLGRVL